MRNIDFGRHSDDYARHRPGFPSSFYARLESLMRLDGSRALDLATGPGVIALELGKRGARTTGIDISEGQIAAALRATSDCGLEEEESVDFVVTEAEDTGLEPAAFDLVTAGQCWHWFDRPKIVAEVQRVLRPGGLLVVAYYSYLAEYCAVARETEKLILKFNPSWSMAGSTGMYSEEIDTLIKGGFALVEQFCYHEDERCAETSLSRSS
jgi:ubiquinone/menaquinone biosynthesis C-methylase UbiE